MKFFLLYIIIAISFMSCKKDDNENNDNWGTASALRNGEYWTGEISAADNAHPSDIGVNIFISKVNNAGIDEDFLVFYKVPTVIGKNTISPTTLYAIDSLVGMDYTTLVSDSHVFGDVYNLLPDDSVEDYIEITEISGDEIMGNFQVSLLRNTSASPSTPNTPDTLIFSEGQFHTRIRN